jgi:hypothetical protein
VTDQPFSYLRSVCHDLPERMILGRAIQNGWSSEELTKVAEGFREGLFGRSIASKEVAYRQAIYVAACHAFDGSPPCKCYWLLASAPIALDTSSLQQSEKH